MANGDDTADLVGPGADTGAGADSGVPAGPPPGAQPQGPPQGGGPIMAALARRQQGPGVSAPGPGNQASAMNMIQQAVSMIQQALPSLPQGSPIHTSALRAAAQLSRHVGQGQPTAGVQQTHMRDLLQNIVRHAMLQRIMASQQGGQGGRGGGQQAAAPMPTTPQPGA